MTDYHRKRQNRKTGEIILEKRAKLISALPIKSYTCVENYQECFESICCSIMVNGHANQIAHVPELFQNNTQAKIDELMDYRNLTALKGRAGKFNQFLIGQLSTSSCDQRWSADD
ncbi:hypothetical protein T02_9916 [Trichinella nativa]|uniref:Uncharacterized protein n=1 Tax=Trichinella nativa TaxID=6335 RepID=A0A0V1LHC9_9BILA|nr:hypothetical protein T02_9916 [Trichinella nativa]